MGALKGILGALLALSIWSSAAAQTGSIETDLKPVIDKLARTASTQQFSQIIDAARASPKLATQLARLIAQGKLTELRIVPAKPAGSLFGAWVNGSTIFVTADFLKAQLGHAESPLHARATILPNNTVYLLGHLAYHLSAGQPDPRSSARMDEFIRKKLEIEAGAYIQGFNDVVDAAVQSNGGKPLTDRQHLLLLLNSRYDKALGKAKLSPTGTIEPDAQNIAAVVGALKELPVAAIE